MQGRIGYFDWPKRNLRFFFSLSWFAVNFFRLLVCPRLPRYRQNSTAKFAVSYLCYEPPPASVQSAATAAITLLSTTCFCCYCNYFNRCWCERMTPSTVYKHNYEGVDLGEDRLGLPKRVTASRGGRAWFARGWMHILNFHHEEAMECFKRCIEIDALCAMALWGIGERLARLVGCSTETV